MKTLRGLMAVWVALSPLCGEAALVPFTQKNKHTVIRDGKCEYLFRRETFHFQVEVIGDESGLKNEIQKDGRPFIEAKPEERYAIRLHNPLPVRVAVNLTVDGLNSLTGKPSGIEDGAKWIIDPHSYITIRGWQVNEQEARRFYFTDKPKSYAAWRGEKLNKNLSVNCGVIGAAYFWSRQELQSYYDEHPTYANSSRFRCGLEDTMKSGAGAPSMESERFLEDKDERRVRKEKAGTGMGERESNPTAYVDFHYDTGMYSADQAVVLYYDFVPTKKPNPFPNLSFAPEMP